MVVGISQRKITKGAGILFCSRPPSPFSISPFPAQFLFSMAPSKQGSKQGKGKEIVAELGEESHTKLVSEPSEGGMSSSPNSEELAQIRKVQDHLLAAVSNMFAKFELLLQSRIDGLGNREGIGASYVRVPANGEDVDDRLQGSHHDRQLEEQLMLSGSRQHQEEQLQGTHDHPQQEFWRPLGNRQNGMF